MTFRTPLLVALCLVVALFAPSAFAQPTVIAYWAQNDNNLPGGGFGFAPATFPIAADQGAGSLSLANFDTETIVNGNGDTVYRWIQSFAGTTINAQPGFDGGGSLSPQGGPGNSNNGMQILIAVSTVGYEGISLSWAQQRTGTGFNSSQVAWSADGGASFTDFGNTGVVAGSFELQSFNFSSVAALNDNPDVVFRITLGGASAQTGNNRFDNIAVTGVSLGTGGAVIPYELAFSTDPYTVGWTRQDLAGVPNWAWNASFSNVSFSAFASGQCTPTESWFISPGFDMDAQDNERLFVDLQRGFSGDDPLTLWFSDDYSGEGDPNDASWTLLDTITPDQFSANNSTVTFGPYLELRDKSGIGHFAARGLFETGGCSTWRVMGLRIDIEDVSTPFACTTDPEDDDAVTRIHTIQGDGSASPLVGQTVEVQAVVVGVFQDTAAFELGGIFLQEPDERTDDNPLTSEGVFVALTTPSVAIGDEVRVRGVVREQFAQTELFQVDAFALCAEDQLGRVSPAELSLPVDDLAEFEAVEGMWVRLTQALTVTEVFNAARFAEFTVAPERLFTPTQVVAPGAPAIALQELNDRSRLIIDEGRTGSYRLPYQPGLDGSPLNAGNPIRTGYRIQADFDGIMGFAFSNYRVFSLQPAVFDDSDNPRLQAPPELPEGNLRAASFNVENLFSTIQTGNVGCGPNNLSCRGASSESELARQLIKVTEAILALNADVIGLIEIENDDDDATLALLVDALNAVDSLADWAFIPTGFQGTDAIKNAIIYRTGKLIPVGETAVLDSSVVITPPFDDSRQRPVLTQAFEHVDGGRFAMSVLHLRSKNASSSSSPQPGDPNFDNGDGQGWFNGLRTESVQSLYNWLATDPTGTGTDRHLVLGDYNAYGQEDPLQVLINAGYTNLAIAANGGDPAVYSYVFQGQSGSLDHVLASPTMNELVLGATNWAINADEIPAFAYPETLPSSSLPKPADFFGEDPFRSSDHDPLIVSLAIVPEPALLQIAHLAPFASGADTAVNIVVNGIEVLSDVRYGDSTGYLALPGGTAEIEIIPVGAVDPAIAATVELESDLAYTAIAKGDGVNQPLALALLVDDLTPPPAGQFRIRLGHVAPFADGPASAEVRLADGTLIQAVDYADFSNGLELPAGAYDLRITAPGGEPVLIDPIAIDLSEGQILSAFATGDGANQRLGAFALPAGEPGFFIDLNAGLLLDDLVQVYTGDPLPVSVLTDPEGLAVELLYDGLPEAPADAGSYSVLATVVEPGFVGSAEALLVIEPAPAQIDFDGLTQVFTGAALSPLVLTEPAGLNVLLSFEGQPEAPSAVGDYVVIAAIDEPNFVGEAAAIFRIVEASGQSLGLAGQPGESNLAGLPLSPATRVEVRNGAGEIVEDDNETVIELVLLLQVPGTAQPETLGVFASQIVTAGVAEFSDLVIDVPASGYRLLVRDAEGLLPVLVSAPFSVVGDGIFQDRFDQP